MRLHCLGVSCALSLNGPSVRLPYVVPLAFFNVQILRDANQKNVSNQQKTLCQSRRTFTFSIGKKYGGRKEARKEGWKEGRKEGSKASRKQGRKEGS